MKQIFEGVYVGSQEDEPIEGWATIHAAKNPYHVDAVGYKGKLEPSHPNYLMLRKENDLYLNMIDPPFELLADLTNPMFQESMNFIAQAIIDDKNILVRCNKGQSRSPSIILVFMAFGDLISKSSYAEAKKEFMELYPEYSPGEGVAKYLEKNWQDLVN